MLRRQTSGSVVCATCGSLVGVNDDTCYSCGRRNPGLWGYAGAIRRLGSDLGFVQVVIIGSSILYVLSLLMSNGQIGMSGFNLLAPSQRALLQLGSSGAVPFFVLDRWWTILSAGWLHGSLLHILFNMYWVRQLGPATADVFGPGRMVIIYTISGAVGFLMSSIAGFYMPGVPLLGGAGFTVGASASIFGLLGALVAYGRLRGDSAVRSQALTYAAMLFVFGLVMSGVDNWAHAGGFAGGYLSARLLDPMQRERVNHLIGALVCLVVTAIAVLWSIVHYQRMLSGL
ncbi:MAG: rhomboid family intramembrane serine protease [Acidobacteriota bacterium]|nr:rhomboid family intramembrane serine protease [Acidobacteriota bacterium]